MQIKIATKVWQDPVWFIAFGFGSGLLPKAPGTWGTLAAFPVYLLIASLTTGWYLFVALLLFLLGVWVSERVTQALKVQDYPGIVWDEVVGYLLTMTAVPITLGWMLTGFVLFRIFDIWKPQPIRYIDKHVKGGAGVMIDDVLAALPAWIILQLLIRGFA